MSLARALLLVFLAILVAVAGLLFVVNAGPSPDIDLPWSA
jgi:hypothetical protein